jgi:RNA polymerase sigma-70 factor (ECF subfamily)
MAERLDAGALAERHYAEVLRLAWRLTGSREAGEDVTQEVFLHLHRRGIALEAEGNPLAYLRRMAARRAWRLMKAAPPESAMPEQEPPAPGERADETAGRAAQWRKVMACVNRLPAKTRAVFLLREVEQLDNAEVAEMLGMLQVTVRRHAQIAREKLREMLGEAE